MKIPLKAKSRMKKGLIPKIAPNQSHKPTLDGVLLH
jgi:hypothetical protein